MNLMTSTELKEKIYDLCFHAYSSEFVNFLLDLINDKSEPELKAIKYKYLAVVSDYKKDFPDRNQIAETDLPCLQAINFILNTRGTPTEERDHKLYKVMFGCTPEEMLKTSKGSIVTRLIKRLKEDGTL